MPEITAETTCLCGCGTPVIPPARWKRGHSARGERGYDPARHGGGRVEAFPPPGADFDQLAADAEPFGPIIDVSDAPTASPPPASGSSWSESPPEAGGPPADEPPAHARREWRQKPKGKSRSAPKITAAVHADIAAKVSLILEVPGQVWAARDPLCGGVFVTQRPHIADALTDIVCESADLVAFFTGPAGGFMRFLDLSVAVFPVIQAVMAHHVYHSIEPGEVAQPDYAGYAA